MFNSSVVLSAKDLGIVPINEKIDIVVGDTATKLTRPADRTCLVVHVTSGSFEIKPGDHVSSFPSASGTTTTTGTQTVTLVEGTERVYAAPDELTVKGASASDKLKYYWF